MLSRRNLLLVGATALVAGVPAARAEDLKPKASCAQGVRSGVQCMALSPDSQILLSGHYLGDIRFCAWDAANLQLIKSWPAHKDRVHSVQFHPSGKFFASGGDNGILYFWDPRTGEKLAELSAAQDIRGVAFSADGKLIAAAARNRMVRVWDVATKKIVHDLEGPGPNMGLVAISKTNLLFACDGSGKGRIWDLATNKVVDDFQRHIHHIQAAQFSEDGKFILTACIKEIRRIKVGEREEVKVAPFDKLALSVAWTPDGSLQASYHNVGILEFRRAGKEPKRVSVVDGRMCTSMCFDKTGKRLYTGVSQYECQFPPPHPRDDNPLINLWDVESLLAR